MPHIEKIRPHRPRHGQKDQAQALLAGEALRHASETMAAQAELLAREMEFGTLADRGGPDALRLFAALVRAHARDPFGETVGNA